MLATVAAGFGRVTDECPRLSFEDRSIESEQLEEHMKLDIFPKHAQSIVHKLPRDESGVKKVRLRPCLGIEQLREYEET